MIKNNNLNNIESGASPKALRRNDVNPFERSARLQRSPSKQTHSLSDEFLNITKENKVIGGDIVQIMQSNAAQKKEDKIKPMHPKPGVLETPDKTVQTGIDRYILVVNKRGRSPRTSTSPKDLKKIKCADEGPVQTSNRFSALDTPCPTGSTDKREDKPKNEKPPPIYLREKSSNLLVNELKAISKGDFFISELKRGTIVETRIQVQSVESYRSITDAFEKKGKSYYTYQLKSSKGLRVVIKGIEAAVDPREITDALVEKGFCVKSCINLINAKRIPQPMFRVELDSEMSIQKSKEIYNLKRLLWRRIVVEEPFKRSTLVQCHKCQEFGHTKTYCRLSTVCVVCSGFHEAKNCNTNRNDTEVKKCSNCGGNHTANYRGCPVYVSLKNQLNVRVNARQRQQQIFGNNQYKPNIYADTEQVPAEEPGSYAAAVKSTRKPIPAEPTSEVKDNLNQLIRMMEGFMKSMENNMNMLMQSFATITQLLVKSHNA